jgi:hypothetical protein
MGSNIRMMTGTMIPPDKRGSSRKSRFLRCAVACAPAPIGMTETQCRRKALGSVQLTLHACVDDLRCARLFVDADLLEHAELIPVVPALDDLAVGKADDGDASAADGVSGRGHTETISRVRHVA